MRPVLGTLTTTYMMLLLRMRAHHCSQSIGFWLGTKFQCCWIWIGALWYHVWFLSRSRNTTKKLHQNDKCKCNNYACMIFLSLTCTWFDLHGNSLICNLTFTMYLCEFFVHTRNSGQPICCSEWKVFCANHGTRRACHCCTNKSNA